MKLLLLVFFGVHVFAGSELPNGTKPANDTKEIVWKKTVDPDSGHTFYFNNVGESRWDAPDSVQWPNEIETVDFVPAVVWKQSVDPESGNTFYFNNKGESVWYAPESIAIEEIEKVDFVPPEEL